MSENSTATTIFSCRSLVELFHRTVAAGPDRPAIRRAGTAEVLTWRETADLVGAVAAGLRARGVGRGDSVALLMGNVPEFHLCDLAALHLGAVPVSLYPTDPLERMAAVIAASGSRVVLATDRFATRAGELQEACPGLVHCPVDGLGGPGSTALEALLDGADPAFDAAEAVAAVPPGATACLLYTSGTTGAPKGVELSHRAILTAVGHYAEVAPLTPFGRVLSYLPTAHIADRFAGHYAAIAYGHEVTCVDDPAILYDTMRAVRPTHFFAVPRIIEKLWAEARAMIEPVEEAELARRRDIIHERGFAVHGDPLTTDDRFAAVRARLGLDSVEWLTVGSAPSSQGVVEWLAALGLPFADIWGMTEIIVCTMNPPHRMKLGTIGQAFARIEFRVLADGELLARGPSAFTAYRDDPARTDAARDGDGWIHTGDLAAIDDEGYVRIVGRKKEMMINAAGKNMSPVEIEGAIKGTSPLIDHVAAVGEGRRFVTAVIALDGVQLARFATDHGLVGSHRELAAHPLVRAELEGAVERGNARLARVEQVRSWVVVGEEWLPGGAEVTASSKLVRARVHARYASEIEKLYG